MNFIDIKMRASTTYVKKLSGIRSYIPKFANSPLGERTATTCRNVSIFSASLVSSGATNICVPLQRVLVVLLAKGDLQL